MTAAVIFLLIVALAAACAAAISSNAARGEKLSAEEKINHAVEKALAARDRVLRDPDHARKLRNRFRR